MANALYNVNNVESMIAFSSILGFHGETKSKVIYNTTTEIEIRNSKGKMKCGDDEKQQ